MANTPDRECILKEDLEIIMHLLEEESLQDEEFISQMDSAVEEITVSGNFPGEFCAKVCKSRHTRTKHVGKLDKQVVEVPKDKIHNLRFKVLIEQAAIKLRIL